MDIVKLKLIANKLHRLRWKILRHHVPRLSLYPDPLPFKPLTLILHGVSFDLFGIQHSCAGTPNPLYARWLRSHITENPLYDCLLSEKGMETHHGFPAHKSKYLCMHDNLAFGFWEYVVLLLHHYYDPRIMLCLLKLCWRDSSSKNPTTSLHHHPEQLLQSTHLHALKPSLQRILIGFFPPKMQLEVNHFLLHQHKWRHTNPQYFPEESPPHPDHCLDEYFRSSILMKVSHRSYYFYCFLEALAKQAANNGWNGAPLHHAGVILGIGHDTDLMMLHHNLANFEALCFGGSDNPYRRSACRAVEILLFEKPSFRRRLKLQWNMLLAPLVAVLPGALLFGALLALFYQGSS